MAQVSNENMPKVLMTVIRFCITSEDHQIKRLLMLYWESVPKTSTVLDSSSGKYVTKLLPEMILVCNALRNDLLSPNEYIRGNMLRLLGKFKEYEILEPLIPTIIQNLDHRHSYVRKNSILLLFFLYKNFNELILPDIKNILYEKILTEADSNCLRNYFLFLSSYFFPATLKYLVEEYYGAGKDDKKKKVYDEFFSLILLQFIRKNYFIDSIDSTDSGEDLIAGRSAAAFFSANNKKSFFLNIIYNILLKSEKNSSSCLAYEAAFTLTSLTTSSSSVRLSAITYARLLNEVSDQNIKIILLNKLIELIFPANSADKNGSSSLTPLGFNENSTSTGSNKKNLLNFLINSSSNFLNFSLNSILSYFNYSHYNIKNLSEILSELFQCLTSTVVSLNILIKKKILLLLILLVNQSSLNNFLKILKSEFFSQETSNSNANSNPNALNKNSYKILIIDTIYQLSLKFYKDSPNEILNLLNLLNDFLFSSTVTNLVSNLPPSNSPFSSTSGSITTLNLASYILLTTKNILELTQQNKKKLLLKFVNITKKTKSVQNSKTSNKLTSNLNSIKKNILKINLIQTITIHKLAQNISQINSSDSLSLALWIVSEYTDDYNFQFSQNYRENTEEGIYLSGNLYNTLFQNLINLKNTEEDFDEKKFISSCIISPETRGESFNLIQYIYDTLVNLIGDSPYLPINEKELAMEAAAATTTTTTSSLVTKNVILADGTYGSSVVDTSTPAPTTPLDSLTFLRKHLCSSGDIHLATSLSVALTKLTLKLRQKYAPLNSSSYNSENSIKINTKIVATSRIIAGLGKLFEKNKKNYYDCFYRLNFCLKILLDPKISEKLTDIFLLSSSLAFSLYISKNYNEDYLTNLVKELKEKDSRELSQVELNNNLNLNAIVTNSSLVHPDDLLSFRQLLVGSGGSSNLDYDLIESDDLSSAIGDTTGSSVTGSTSAANFTSVAAPDATSFLSTKEDGKLQKIYQLTGYTDPIYAEAVVHVHDYDILLEILVENRTGSTITNLTVELNALGDLKLLDKGNSISLKEKEKKIIKNTIKISSSNIFLLSGIILYNTSSSTSTTSSLSISPIQLDVVNYFKSSFYCSDEEYRQMWQEFEWENKVAISTNILSLNNFLFYLIYSLHMVCLTPVYQGEEAAKYVSKILASNYNEGKGIPSLPSVSGSTGSTSSETDLVNYYDVLKSTQKVYRGIEDKYLNGKFRTGEEDPENILHQISSSSNSNSNVHSQSTSSNFLAANLYARSIFGEDALVNVSVEKKEDQDRKLSGYIRIRSKTQGIALSLGDRITAIQRVSPILAKLLNINEEVDEEEETKAVEPQPEDEVYEEM